MFAHVSASIWFWFSAKYLLRFKRSSQWRSKKLWRLFVNFCRQARVNPSQDLQDCFFFFNIVSEVNLEHSLDESRKSSFRPRWNFYCVKQENQTRFEIQIGFRWLFARFFWVKRLSFRDFHSIASLDSHSSGWERTGKGASIVKIFDQFERVVPKHLFTIFVDYVNGNRSCLVDTKFVGFFSSFTIYWLWLQIGGAIQQLKKFLIEQKPAFK